MKRFLLKVANVSSYIVIGAGGVYTLAAILYGVLPADVTQPIVSALSMNSDVIVPTGISAGVTAGVITTAKLMLKSLNEQLHMSNLNLKIWETDTLKKIDTKYSLQDKLNDVVVIKQNQIIQNQEELAKQNKILIDFNVANAQRQLYASDELVPKPIKAVYQGALDGLKTLNYDVRPIVKIVEQTIIKEVEKPINQSKVIW